MQTNLWFNQTGQLAINTQQIPYGNPIRDYPRPPMGLPSPNATQEEIANDVGSIDPNSPLPKPSMPTQRGCGSNQYTVPFKIQGEEKCIDKTIAMVIGAIAVYYIIKK